MAIGRVAGDAFVIVGGRVYELDCDVDAWAWRDAAPDCPACAASLRWAMVAWGMAGTAAHVTARRGRYVVECPACESTIPVIFPRIARYV